jgi:hypothetical protein
MRIAGIYPYPFAARAVFVNEQSAVLGNLRVASTPGVKLIHWAMVRQLSGLAQQSICARVKIEILHKLTLEREAFEAPRYPGGAASLPPRRPVAQATTGQSPFPSTTGLMESLHDSRIAPWSHEPGRRVWRDVPIAPMAAWGQAALPSGSWAKWLRQPSVAFAF